MFQGEQEYSNNIHIPYEEEDTYHMRRRIHTLAHSKESKSTATIFFLTPLNLKP